MRTIVLAYHDMGCAGLEAVLRHGFEVAAVFTHADDPDENLWFRSVAETAASHGLPVFGPEDINHALWIENIRRLEPEIVFSFYYRQLLGTALLAIPPAGCLNLHGSLLPRYRGRAPVNWAIINGESHTGVTLHYMNESPDAGDIVGQRRVAIDDADTGASLTRTLVGAAQALLDELLPQLRTGSAPRIPQDPAAATYFGRRRPEDGEIDWSASARTVRNLVRAVTRPYPGAFSHVGERRTTLWQVRALSESPARREPGTIVSIEPLVVACGDGAVEVEFAQPDGGLYTSGGQLARDMNLAPGMHFGLRPSAAMEIARRKRVLLLGVNGFIGNCLGEKLLESDRYEVHGMDLFDDAIEHLRARPGFHFHEGDIAIHREWIEYLIKKCDIVVPLVAIATPIEYVRNPLGVFELDFEENLRVVRYCVRYAKRIVFPSTSEVYGMCEEEEFDEDASTLVLGPIRMQRWIYSCSKQLLDRVIWAYGQTESLRFTLFRPFNWIGPRLDSLDSARIGSSRAITQLILNLVEGTPIQLIDGGEQRRCFTDVADGVECLFRIIENRDGACDGEIINIGNPDAELSIKALATMLVEKFEQHPLRSAFPPFAGFHAVESATYYGEGYQDVQYRRPSIRKAWKLLGWKPERSLEESVSRTLDFFLHEAIARARGGAGAEASAPSPD